MSVAFGAPRRRIVIVDGILGSVLAVLGVVEVLADPPGGSAWFYVPAAATCGFALCFRRLHPDWAVVLAAVPVGVAALGDVVLAQRLVPFISSMVAMASLGLHAANPKRSWSLPIAAAAVVAVAANIADWPIDLLYFGLQFALAWSAGYAVRLQLNRIATLAADAARRDAELERDLQTALADERVRMAREIHDIVGHGLSLMVVHAGAAEQHAGEAETVRTSMEAIQEVGRQAVTDMARLLQVLRSDHTEIGLGPQPGLADIEQLCSTARAAGAEVRATIEVEAGTLPATVELTAYRVVQEALTNALRHARGAPIDIDVGWVDDQLTVRVSNAASPSGPSDEGTGHGLAGLEERVRVFGGTLDATPQPDGGFQVEACIPRTGVTG